jgi:TPR repeat protein
VNAVLVKHLEKAAESGDPFAQFEMGFWLDNGYDGNQDFAAASNWYAKAAAQGHATAEANLLQQHVLGQTETWPPDVVLRRLMKLAEGGHRESQNAVGLCYQFGFGAVKDFREAAAWFLRAAQAGLAAAQFNLGGLHYEGKGVEKDFGTAATWYTRAAQQRDELALVQLGSMCQKGIGVEKSLPRAVSLYSIAYGRGSVRAANHLACLFRQGIGIERNDLLAYELFLESVSRPDTPEVQENLSYRGTAYYWLGYMSEHGEGTKQDLRAARQWYSKGAACGQTQCTDALATIRPKSRPQHTRSTRSQRRHS